MKIRRPSRRTVRRLGVAFASFVILVVIAAWLLLYTGVGTRLALAYLRGRLSPTTTIGAMTGRLSSPLELISLRYSGDGLTVTADTVSIEWRLGRFLRRQLDVRRLRVGGVEIETREAAEDTVGQPPALSDVSLPVSLLAPHAEVERIVARRAGDTTTISVDSVLFGIAAGGDTVGVQRLEIFATNAHAIASGSVKMSGPYPVAFDMVWRANVRDHDAAGNGRLWGNLGRLEVRHELTAPVHSDLSAVVDSVLTTRSFVATITADEFGLRDIDSALTPARVRGEVEASGVISAFNANGIIGLEHASIGRADSRIVVNQRDGIWRIDSLDVGFRNHAGRLMGVGTIEMQDGGPVFDALLRWTRLSVPLVGDPRIESSGQLRTSGTANAYEANGTVELHGSGPAAGTIRMLARGTRDSIVLHGSGEALGGDLALDAAMGFTSPDWRAEFDGRGLNVADLFPDTVDWLGSVDVAAAARGVRTDSGLVGAVTVNRVTGLVRDVPYTIEGSGRLGYRRFDIDSARAHLAGGAVRASGEVRWDSTVDWRASLVTSEFDPAPLMPDTGVWHGSLSAGTRITGASTSDGLRTHLIIDTLQGVLRGAQIGARGAVLFDGDTYAIDSVTVAWGDASLLAFGELGERLSGRFEIDARDVGVAIPGAAGSVRSEIDVSGTRPEPEIFLSLNASGLSYGEYGAGSVRGEGVLDFSADGRFDFSVSGSELTVLGRKVDTLDMTVRGVSGNHTIALTARRGANSADLSAVGGLDAWTWRGDVAAVSLVDSFAGRWQLESSVPIGVARDSVVMGDRACLTSEDASTCVAGSWRNGGLWSIVGDARSVPLDRIRRWLPSSVTAAGSVDAEVDLRNTESGALIGSASVDADSGTVTLALRAGDQMLFYERGSLVLAADEEGVRAAIGLAARREDSVDSTYADLNGHLSLPGYRPLIDSLAQRSIEGRFDATLSDLSWIETVMPQLAAVSGSLESSFALSGTVSEPLLAGEARMVGSADVPQLGLELRNAELTAEGEGAGGIGLAGSVVSGSGTLELSGRLNPGSVSDTALELRMSGTRVQAANTPEVQIWISPDIGISTVGRRLSVSGDVGIPRADIELQQIPAIAVPVSRDVLLIGDTTQPARPVMDISSRVRIVLGDSVNFRGFGLTASPRGTLLAVDEPGQATIATGQLSVHDGKYKAYGQDLTIETGRLVFAGGPIDNPGLDIRATRRARDSVTAGLLVAGTLKTPELTVFSDPPMMQSDALSYLILGRPVAALSQSEGGQLTNAAASLGIRGGNMLAQRIGQRFGIDEARIETEGGDWNEASFYAGKYLSPRLYVSYGIGLFDASSLFRIRYMLSQHWTLQAETGERTSTDINYRVERGR